MATKTLPSPPTDDDQIEQEMMLAPRKAIRAVRTLVFEIALAITLCVWTVTLMAWALG
jgi:hypothetical protein